MVTGDPGGKSLRDRRIAGDQRARGRAPRTIRISLDGEWEFRLDADTAWRAVTVPHTWQVEPGLEDYRGVAHYRRQFEARPEWSGQTVRLEFESVFHTADVLLNGRRVGHHGGKGYTAFCTDITSDLSYGAANDLEVRVDNAFNLAMLPRGRSSDWAHDGGIYRPVSLLVTPVAFIERVAIEAVLGRHAASIQATAVVRNAGGARLSVSLRGRVYDESGATVLALPEREFRVAAGGVAEVRLPPATLPAPKLWHFDHPHLYRLELTLTKSGSPCHVVEETFGIRAFEARDGGFWLNGERIWPMGVERMAGSHPRFGMAEPEDWIRHDLADMQNLNCVFTRVHWPQDRRVLDYCDRHGIMVQLEVPAWGFATFLEKTPEPPREIVENGLEQLREMIARDRNHPSVVAWGLCNEIDGQNPPAQSFTRRMYEEAKLLDPRRPCTYASNSLYRNQAGDVSALMDFVSFNEYYGTWEKGTLDDLRRNLREIIRAFPGKPIVISEYGYCACTTDRPEGDKERIRILQEHQAVFREVPEIAGLIFFSYNDYRTQIGDRGTGALRQRVHGVVDIDGRRKPSYEVLRDESSPVERLAVTHEGGQARIELATRTTQPAYTLRRYTLECIVCGQGDIPTERHALPLDDLAPGSEVAHVFPLKERSPLEIRVDVRRPSGVSARSAVLRL